MDGLPTHLPEDRDALIALLKEQQRHHQNQIAAKDKQLVRSKERNAQLRNSVQAKSQTIEKLEERLRALLIQQFGRKSERFNPDQFTLFNEAELTVEAEADEDAVEVKSHTRGGKNTRKNLSDHLPRVDVEHGLDEHERQCSCGGTLQQIGEDVNEQLSIIPRQYFVVRHIRARYACACKNCAKSAPMPAHPLPGAQVTPMMLAHIMVSKLLDGLPLYRQEKMAERDGLELDRTKLARWFIQGSAVFQPVINRFMDTFFDYDIAMSDDTRIRVLKTADDHPNTQSALWIRRGGPPDKPVVLVDYKPTKSGEAAYSLLNDFNGTLVCDGASNFNLSVQRNGLTVALCNDHARRRFRQVHEKLSKEKKHRASMAIASQGLTRYNALYAIERTIKELPAEARLRIREEKAVPLWESFIEWATQKQLEGVRHAGTTDALSYLLKHANELQAYCRDGRLCLASITLSGLATITMSG